MPDQTVVYPNARLTYGRMVLYSEARRTFAENVAAARIALALLLNVPPEELDEHLDPTKPLVLEAYRSY